MSLRTYGASTEIVVRRVNMTLSRSSHGDNGGPMVNMTLSRSCHGDNGGPMVNMTLSRSYHGDNGGLMALLLRRWCRFAYHFSVFEYPSCENFH